jgi:dTDP-4-amino-4,6-dideoxygalactose transaminase
MSVTFPRMSWPVLRPQLPQADRLLPYLRKIDANRVYTNSGPLVQELSQRLGVRFELPGLGVITAASGTTALIGAILGSVGRARPQRPLALIPSFTFVATAVAAEACGYEARFADIDAHSFLLEPHRAVNEPAIGRVGVVIPVGAFGLPVDQAAWNRFRDETGIGVVIDGAACFEAASARPRAVLGEIPVAMSFHATKSFGTAEGGCIATSDVNLALKINRALNFGFLGARDSMAASINGKMSEYHAAVGLAELDGWSEKAEALAEIARAYRRQFARFDLQHRFFGAGEIASCYALFRCKSAEEGQRLAGGLRLEGVDVRFWYGEGMHQQSHYRREHCGAQPVTDRLAPCLVGLPVAPDLEACAIDEITRKVAWLIEAA